ncbi:MAG: hypothetical protein ACRC7O_01625, partial [Fimbriiglobus sp.]
MDTTTLPFDTLDRMVRAVEQVKERLLRSTAVLAAETIPYAVIGGNAVAAWVSRVDPEAIRNTRDVDILLARTDFTAAKSAMASAGFVHVEVAGVHVFIDGPDGRPSGGVHIIFADEKIKPIDPAPAPRIEEAGPSSEGYRVVTLEALVRMKLVAWRRKDQVHLQDMLRV